MTAAPAPEKARAFLEAERIPWVQRFELAPGVMTPGSLDVAHALSVAGLPADLTGRTVVRHDLELYGFSNHPDGILMRESS